MAIIENNINFKSIFYSSEDKYIFYKSLNTFMRSFGCYYIGYFCEDIVSERRIGFSSSTDWENEYMGNKLIDDCHLKNAVTKQFIQTKKRSLILPWDSVSPTTSKQKEIVLYRRDFDIGSGISFCTQNSRYREFFALSPCASNQNFLQHLLPKMKMVKRHVYELRSITSKYITQQKENT